MANATVFNKGAVVIVNRGPLEGRKGRVVGMTVSERVEVNVNGDAGCVQRFFLPAALNPGKEPCPCSADSMSG